MKAPQLLHSQSRLAGSHAALNLLFDVMIFCLSGSLRSTWALISFWREESIVYRFV
jgi:hypothetical protein